jgi:hypothetical protein
MPDHEFLDRVEDSSMNQSLMYSATVDGNAPRQPDHKFLDRFEDNQMNTSNMYGNISKSCKVFIPKLKHQNKP